MTPAAKKGEAWKLAGILLGRIGVPQSGPNVTAIMAMIQAQAEFEGLSLEEAARMLAERLEAALEIMRQLHMVWSWPTMLTVAEAIRCEANCSNITPDLAARVILQSARVVNWMAGVNRFWFEDAKWRICRSYEEFRTRLQEANA